MQSVENVCFLTLQPINVSAIWDPLEQFQSISVSNSNHLKKVLKQKHEVLFPSKNINLNWGLLIKK